MIIAGAGTLSLEVIEQEPQVDAMVIAIGGGSQAVGALTVFAGLKPDAKVYGVQAIGASAAHASWVARKPVQMDRADTIADGLATRSTYELTFPTLLEGLADFVTVTDAEIADAMRMLLRTTHTHGGTRGCGRVGWTPQTGVEARRQACGDCAQRSERRFSYAPTRCEWRGVGSSLRVRSHPTLTSERSDIGLCPYVSINGCGLPASTKRGRSPLSRSTPDASR